MKEKFIYKRVIFGLGEADYSAEAPASMPQIFVLSPQSANDIFAGPTGGTAGLPTFRKLVLADLPDGIGGGGPKTPITLTANAYGFVEWNASISNNARFEIDGYYNLAVTNAVPGQEGTLLVKSLTSNPIRISLGHEEHWSANGQNIRPTLTQGMANTIDILKWYYDGDNFYWHVQNNYTTTFLTE